MLYQRNHEHTVKKVVKMLIWKGNEVVKTSGGGGLYGCFGVWGGMGGLNSKRVRVG